LPEASRRYQRLNRVIALDDGNQLSGWAGASSFTAKLAALLLLEDLFA